MSSVNLQANLAAMRDTPDPDESALRVVITEGTSYIARYLAYRILSDAVFGSDREIILSLYDTEDNAVLLESIGIEITACAPNLLKGTTFNHYTPAWDPAR